jgi:putative ABC transport system permease protein
MVRSLSTFVATDYGFDTENLIFARVLLDAPRYEDPEAIRLAGAELQDRISALPEIDSASVWSPGPPGASHWFSYLVPEGRESDPSYHPSHTWYHMVTPEAPQALGLKLVSGRFFTVADDADAPRVGLLSKTAAEQLWPGEDPLGRRLAVPGEEDWIEVVGIVTDAYQRGLGRTHSEVLRDLYLPFAQWPISHLTLMVRSGADPEAVADGLRWVVAEVDPSLAVFEVQTMEQSRATDAADLRFKTLLLVLFGLAALILTTLGLSSVMASSAKRRQQEVAIRVAMGAGPARVVSAVLRRAVVDMAVGTLIGAVAAVWVARVMESLLYGVRGSDPMAWGAAIPLLVLVAVAATLMPVRRALRVTPAEVLRGE